MLCALKTRQGAYRYTDVSKCPFWPIFLQKMSLGDSYQLNSYKEKSVYLSHVGLSNFLVNNFLLNLMLDLRVWGVVGIACSVPVCRVGQVHAEVIFRPSAMHAENKPLHAELN